MGWLSYRIWYLHAIWISTAFIDVNARLICSLFIFNAAVCTDVSTWTEKIISCTCGGYLSNILNRNEKWTHSFRSWMSRRDKNYSKKYQNNSGFNRATNMRDHLKGLGSSFFSFLHSPQPKVIIKSNSLWWQGSMQNKMNTPILANVAICFIDEFTNGKKM